MAACPLSELSVIVPSGERFLQIAVETAERHCGHFRLTLPKVVSLPITSALNWVYFAVIKMNLWLQPPSPDLQSGQPPRNISLRRSRKRVAV